MYGVAASVEPDAGAHAMSAAKPATTPTARARTLAAPRARMSGGAVRPAAEHHTTLGEHRFDHADHGARHRELRRERSLELEQPAPGAVERHRERGLAAAAEPRGGGAERHARAVREPEPQTYATDALRAGRAPERDDHGRLGDADAADAGLAH